MLASCAFVFLGGLGVVGDYNSEGTPLKTKAHYIQNLILVPALLVTLNKNLKI